MRGEEALSRRGQEALWTEQEAQQDLSQVAAATCIFLELRRRPDIDTDPGTDTDTVFMCGLACQLQLGILTDIMMAGRQQKKQLATAVVVSESDVHVTVTFTSSHVSALSVHHHLCCTLLLLLTSMKDGHGTRTYLILSLALSYPMVGLPKACHEWGGG